MIALRPVEATPSELKGETGCGRCGVGLQLFQLEVSALCLVLRHAYPK